MSNENTIECLERLQEENDDLLAEVKRLRSDLEINYGHTNPTMQTSTLL